MALTTTLPGFYNSATGQIDTMVAGTNAAGLGVGGTQADLRATGPGVLVQASSGAAISIDATVPLAMGGTAQSNASITANEVWAGPGSGSASSAAYRALVAADIPGTLGSTVLGNGSTATTQSALDDSTKLATTAYADSAVATGIASIGAPNVITGINANGSTLLIGSFVYGTATLGDVNLAQANSSSTCKVLGMAQNAAATTASVMVQTGDAFAFGTTAEVDAIFGTTGGFAASGVPYWLSPGTAGLATATAPSTTGQKSVLLGYSGLTSKQFILRVGPVYTV